MIRTFCFSRYNLCKLIAQKQFLPFTFIFKRNCSKMGDNSYRVSLICPDGNHDPIQLKHKEAVFVGRSPETRIVDARCSRKQVQLVANLKTSDVEAIQLGSNSSSLDGVEMIKDKVYTMKPTSTLCVLTGLYPQKLKIKNLEQKDERKTSSTKNTVVDSSKSSKHKERSSSSSSSKSSKKSESDSHSSKRKASSTSSDINGNPAKKPRVSEERDKKSVKKHNSENDDAGVKEVAAKLEMLKSSAKSIKTPTNSVSQFFNAAVSSSNSSSNSKVSSPSPQTGSVKPAPESRWDQFESLYVYTSKGLTSRKKIAAFDIDGTIITTQSGKVFPTHPGDWRLLYQNEVPKKIRKLHADGYKVVFITNQMGVSKGKTHINDLKEKFGDVLDEIKVPVQILVSTKGGVYRKPCTGMWDYIVEKGNDGLSIELSQSFYVGDAAGRPKDWMPKKKKDFSSSDRLFALNIGINFRTPEEYFMGYPTAKFIMPEFDPRKLSCKTALLGPPSANITSDKQEVIVFVGYPASGKSFFYKKHLEPHGYIHVNRDTLGTWQKCVSVLKDNLKKGKNVAIDNTNPDVESRARFISIARAQGIPCRCFELTSTKDHCRHNERFREITDKSHQAINDMIMNSFKSKFKTPELKEGFTEIVKVNFVPKFKDTKLEKLYRMFLLEK